MINEERKAAKNFTDLVVWQKAHVFVVDVYRATKTFPAAEQYGLVSQMRRAAVSVTSNIAEGFSYRGYKMKTRFYYIAAGSLTELENQIYIAHDVGYVSSESRDALKCQLKEVQKMLHVLIRNTKLHFS